MTLTSTAPFAVGTVWIVPVSFVWVEGRDGKPAASNPDRIVSRFVGTAVPSGVTTKPGAVCVVVVLTAPCCEGFGALEVSTSVAVVGGVAVFTLVVEDGGVLVSTCVAVLGGVLKKPLTVSLMRVVAELTACPRLLCVAG